MSKKVELGQRLYRNSLLKLGDTVYVLSGGNKNKNSIKGETGRIIKFAGNRGDRVVLEGLNYRVKHKRQMGPEDKAEIIRFEGSMHLSNVMYFDEKAKRPFRLCSEVDAKGKKQRGYKDPKTKKFIAI